MVLLCLVIPSIKLNPFDLTDADYQWYNVNGYAGSTQAT